MHPVGHDHWACRWRGAAQHTALPRRAGVVAQASLSCPCGAIHLLAPYNRRMKRTGHIFAAALFSEQEARNLTSGKGVVEGRGITFRQFVDNVKSLGNTVRFYFGKVSNSLG